MPDVTLLLRCLAVLTCAALAACSSTAPGAASSRRSTGSPSAAPSSAAPPSVLPPDAGPGTYLALGDSVAAGVGADVPRTEGYVPVLARLLERRPPCGGPPDACRLRVVDLSVPGATTASLLRGQLPRALELLRNDSGVRLVTVTVGGNDVFLPVVQACGRSVQDPGCPRAVRASLAQVDAGVDELLRRLTDAAGSTPVAVMAYYDPLPACRLAALSPLAQQVLEGTGGEQGLNDILRERAAQHGAVVVETAQRLTPPRDFVGGLDCLHPSTSGHARIAQAFLDAVGGRVAGPDAGRSTAAQDVGDRVERCLLADELVRAQAQRVVPDAVGGGEHDDAGVGRHRAQLGQDVEPCPAGQVLVEQDDVGLQQTGLHHCLAGRGDGADDAQVELVVEVGRDDSAEHVAVVHDEDAEPSVHREPPMQSGPVRR